MHEDTVQAFNDITQIPKWQKDVSSLDKSYYRIHTLQNSECHISTVEMVNQVCQQADLSRRDTKFQA